MVTPTHDVGMVLEALTEAMLTSVRPFVSSPDHEAILTFPIFMHEEIELRLVKNKPLPKSQSY